METVKELLPPEAFNKLSYVSLIFWIALDSTLLVLFGTAETNGIENFNCADVEIKNKDFIKGVCFKQYKEQYNESDSVYVFVLFQLIPVSIVSFIYGQYMKRRIQKLERSNGIYRRNTERSNRWNWWNNRKIFCIYSCQLIVRLIIGIIFLALQIDFLTQYLPSSYACEHPKPTFNLNTPDQLKRSNNTTNGSTTEKYNCGYHRAEKKKDFAWGLVAVNVLSVVSLALELVWILIRVIKTKQFMVDAHFLAVHLQSKDLLNVFIRSTKDHIRQCTKQLRLIFPYYVEEGKTMHEIEIDQVCYPKLLLYPERVDYNRISEDTQKLFLRKSGRTLEKPEAMFVPGQCNSILIFGSPGIGKTFLCEKLLRDWASSKTFDKNSGIYFDVAFLFSFRRFNSVERFSLYELLARAEHSNSDLEHAVISFIRQNSSRILLVFDGLDEFSDKRILIDDNNYNAYHGNDESVKMPFHVLYRKLASGRLLTGATVVTTVRSQTVSSLKRLPFTRLVEILEFKREEVESCVEKFTTRAEVKETIWHRISSNTMLLTMCCLPVNCLIVCSYLQLLLQLNCQSTPKKLTEVFTGILKMFVFSHNPEYHSKTQSLNEFKSNTFPRTVHGQLTQLGEIAYHGISHGNLIFESQTVTDLETTGVLHRLPELPFGPGVEYQPQYCFAHLNMQEFLAAWYLVKRAPERLQKFVSDNIVEDKWQQVIQFVGGLSNSRTINNILNHLLPIVPERKPLSNEDADFEEAEQSAVLFWPSKKDKTVVLTLCKFMFECHKLSQVASRTSVKKVTCDVIDLSECTLTSVDCAAIAHVLPHIGTCEILHVRLNNNYIGPLGCTEIGKIFSLNRDLTTLEIDGNDITDHGVERLCSALSESNWNLKRLSLGRNEITDEGVEHLCKVLATSQCKISQLNLSCNKITDTGVKSLLDTLSRDECKINHINLAKIEITGEGIKSLSDALATGRCKLSRLNLSRNNITDEHVKNMSERALSKKECKLNQLILSNNKISDVGVEHLSNALSNEDCQLNQLCLSFNKITDTGMCYLSRALSKDTCSLQSLKLAGNNEITHDGVKNLSDVLKNKSN